jgi:CheY-like chemotaxis protein
MPGMKGIDALRKLKAADVTRAIPVIMVTSESEKSHVLEAVRAGAANYMVKPITAEVVKDKLAAYMIHYGAVPASLPAEGEKGKISEAAKPADAPAGETKPGSPQ